MDRLSSACSLIRTYNNNPDIVKAVSRALAAGVGHIVVVVNAADPTTRGNVRNWLDGMIHTNPGRIEVFEMLHGYAWSSALNLGFMHAAHLSEELMAKGEGQIKTVIPTSVEALYEPGHLDRMVDEASNVGMVGTTFVGRLSGRDVNLGKTYRHPRNTLSAIRLEVFKKLGCFSPICDDLGGMEDLHFLVRVEAANLGWKLLDLRVPLIVGTNYHQPTKEARELEAVKKILDYERRVVAGLEGIIERLGVA